MELTGTLAGFFLYFALQNAVLHLSFRALSKGWFLQLQFAARILHEVEGREPFLPPAVCVSVICNFPVKE